MRFVGDDMPKSRHQTRLDEDTAVRVETYQQDQNITESEALRRLVEKGLDAHEGKVKMDGDAIRRDLDRIMSRVESNEDTKTVKSANLFGDSATSQVVEAVLPWIQTTLLILAVALLLL
jgi:Flp pilus assembly protein TadB